MQAGLLTGAFTAERAKALPADDWRSRNAEFTGAKLNANLELAETMKAVGKRHGTSAAAAAIAWTLAWPGVSGAIVGAREPEPGRRLDRRRNPAPAPGRPRRDRQDHRAHRGRLRPGAAGRNGALSRGSKA